MAQQRIDQDVAPLAIGGAGPLEVRLQRAVGQQAIDRALDQGVRGQVAGVLGGH